MNVIKHFAGQLVRYMRSTRAVAAMEYAVIVGVVVVGVGGAATLFSDAIVEFITEATSQVTAEKDRAFDGGDAPAPTPTDGA